MGFHVGFDPAASPIRKEIEAMSLEIDEDYDTLVIKACNDLAEAGGSTFHMSGFGRAEWADDVAYDMSAFVEQLPPLLEAVREYREVAVYLYPQGVERTLTFRPVGDNVIIHCASWTSWVPRPESESVKRSELLSMLTELATNVAKGLKAIGSNLADIAPFVDWREGNV